MSEFKCPKNEHPMTQCNDAQGQEIAHITRKITEPTKHCLYMIVDGVWKKVSTSDNPYDLYEIVYKQ